MAVCYKPVFCLVVYVDMRRPPCKILPSSPSLSLPFPSLPFLYLSHLLSSLFFFLSLALLSPPCLFLLYFPLILITFLLSSFILPFPYFSFLYASLFPFLSLLYSFFIHYFHLLFSSLSFPVKSTFLPFFSFFISFTFSFQAL